MSITEINRYQVFSGHFDWSLLDCIKGPKYVFTILREPIDRILSFYLALFARLFSQTVLLSATDPAQHQ